MHRCGRLFQEKGVSGIVVVVICLGAHGDSVGGEKESGQIIHFACVS